MTTRRLAAILAADVVGFSSLMGQDEEGTLARIKPLRREVIEPKVQEHHGRVVKTTGDGLLVEFASPVEAVRCAVAVQEALAARAAHGAFTGHSDAHWHQPRRHHDRGGWRRLWGWREYSGSP